MKQLFYSKHRVFGTDIHVLRFNPKDFVFEAIQTNSNQKISAMTSTWWESKGYKKVAGINASFMPITGLNYLYEGLFISNSVKNDEYMEVCYDKNGLHVGDFNFEEMMSMYSGVKWAIPLGNLLVLDGHQNLTKAGMFTHSTEKHPRTMLGSLANGEVVFVVAEGRNSGDSGLTSVEQATFMLDIGCNWAVNCDGGGSSTMQLDGKIMNYLSDGTERPVKNGLFLFAQDTYTVSYRDFTSSEDQHPLGIFVIDKVEIAMNFELSEITCRHCGEVKFLDYRLMIVAQAVRDYFGKAIRLVGYRCAKHNIAIGGDPNSLHVQGLALDISAWYNDIKPEDIAAFILKTFKWVTKVKTYPGSHVHIQSTWMID